MANIEKLMDNVESRMIKNSEQKKNHKVYRFKEFSTPHIALYPLMILYWCYDKLKEKILSFIKWDDVHANRIITECIIRNGELNDGDIYYYWRTWGVWWYDKYHSRWRNRAFCRKYNNALTLYFVNEYQLEGYTKEVEFDDGWYNFTFTKINRVCG